MKNYFSVIVVSDLNKNEEVLDSVVLYQCAFRLNFLPSEAIMMILFLFEN